MNKLIYKSQGFIHSHHGQGIDVHQAALDNETLEHVAVGHCQLHHKGASTSATFRKGNDATRYGAHDRRIGGADACGRHSAGCSCPPQGTKVEAPALRWWLLTITSKRAMTVTAGGCLHCASGSDGAPPEHQGCPRETVLLRGRAKSGGRSMLLAPLAE